MSLCGLEGINCRGLFIMHVLISRVATKSIDTSELMEFLKIHPKEGKKEEKTNIG